MSQFWLPIEVTIGYFDGDRIGIDHFFAIFFIFHVDPIAHVSRRREHTVDHSGLKIDAICRTTRSDTPEASALTLDGRWAVWRQCPGVMVSCSAAGAARRGASFMSCSACGRCCLPRVRQVRLRSVRCISARHREPLSPPSTTTAC